MPVNRRRKRVQDKGVLGLPVYRKGKGSATKWDGMKVPVNG